MTRCSAPVLLANCLALASCTIFVDLDEDHLDGQLVVFDADPTTDAAVDGPFIPGDCAMALPCPAPTAGRASLCGRLWDTETERPLAPAPGAVGARCDPTAPAASGPCALDVRFYDALDFASNPTAAVPLAAPDGAYLDDCGRYRGLDLPRATFGFLGVAVDDAPTAADVHVLTGVSTSNALASPGTGFAAYATRRTTDLAWTASAGLSGPSFAQRGVLLNVFRHRDAPVAGVQARRNGELIAADDYYFADTTVARATVEPARTVTGPNGSVLIVDSATPIAHDGTGAAPAGCQWPSTLGASIAGVVFVQRKDAEAPGGGACP